MSVQIPASVIFPRDDLFSRKREKASEAALTRFSLRIEFLALHRHRPQYGFDCNRLCQRECVRLSCRNHDIKPPLRPLRPALFTGSQCQINERDTISIGVMFHDRPQLSLEEK